MNQTQASNSYWTSNLPDGGLTNGTSTRERQKEEARRQRAQRHTHFEGAKKNYLFGEPIKVKPSEQDPLKDIIHVALGEFSNVAPSIMSEKHHLLFGVTRAPQTPVDGKGCFFGSPKKSKLEAKKIMSDTNQKIQNHKTKELAKLIKQTSISESAKKIKKEKSSPNGEKEKISIKVEERADKTSHVKDRTSVNCKQTPEVCKNPEQKLKSNLTRKSPINGVIKPEPKDEISGKKSDCIKSPQINKGRRKEEKDRQNKSKPPKLSMPEKLLSHCPEGVEAGRVDSILKEIAQLVAPPLTGIHTPIKGSNQHGSFPFPDKPLLQDFAAKIKKEKSCLPNDLILSDDSDDEQAEQGKNENICQSGARRDRSLSSSSSSSGSSDESDSDSSDGESDSEKKDAVTKRLDFGLEALSQRSTNGVAESPSFITIGGDGLRGNQCAPGAHASPPSTQELDKKPRDSPFELVEDAVCSQTTLNHGEKSPAGLEEGPIKCESFLNKSTANSSLLNEMPDTLTSLSDKETLVHEIQTPNLKSSLGNYSSAESANEDKVSDEKENQEKKKKSLKEGETNSELKESKNNLKMKKEKNERKRQKTTLNHGEKSPAGVEEGPNKCESLLNKSTANSSLLNEMPDTLTSLSNKETLVHEIQTPNLKSSSGNCSSAESANEDKVSDEKENQDKKKKSLKEGETNSELKESKNNLKMKKEKNERKRQKTTLNHGEKSPAGVEEGPNKCESLLNKSTANSSLLNEMPDTLTSLSNKETLVHEIQTPNLKSSSGNCSSAESANEDKVSDDKKDKGKKKKRLKEGETNSELKESKSISKLKKERNDNLETKELDKAVEQAPDERETVPQNDKSDVETEKQPVKKKKILKKNDTKCLNKGEHKLSGIAENSGDEQEPGSNADIPDGETKVLNGFSSPVHNAEKELVTHMVNGDNQHDSLIVTIDLGLLQRIPKVPGTNGTIVAKLKIKRQSSIEGNTEPVETKKQRTEVDPTSEGRRHRERTSSLSSTSSRCSTDREGSHRKRSPSQESDHCNGHHKRRRHLVDRENERGKSHDHTRERKRDRKESSRGHNSLRHRHKDLDAPVDEPVVNGCSPSSRDTLPCWCGGKKEDSSFSSYLERLYAPDPRVPQTPEYYLQEAKRLKHKADGMNDKDKKAIGYVEAVIQFMKCGRALEQSESPDSLSSACQMYRETRDLLSYAMRQFVSRPSQQSDGSSDKRLMALCLRMQSVLHMKMFRAKKDLAQKNNRILLDYFKDKCQQPKITQAPSPCTSNPSKMTGTPSPLSPTPSPSGSIGSISSVGSSGSQEAVATPSRNGKQPSNTLASPGNACIPQKIYTLTSQHLNCTSHLVVSHEKWDQAYALVLEHKDFFIDLDKKCGPLTTNSSVVSVTDYVQEALSRLKAL